MISSVIGFFKSIPKKMWYVILGSVIILSIMLNIKSCRKNNELKDEIKQQQERHERNLEAKNDTLRKNRNKIGDLTTSISSYETTLENLKYYNDSLHSVVQNQRGKIQSLIDVEPKIIHDTIKIKNELNQISQGLYSLDFQNTYREDGLYSKIKGSSRIWIDSSNIRPDSTIIYQNEIGIDLKLGFREFEDRYEVFATTPSDKVLITDLKGVSIINKDEIKTSTSSRDPFSIGIGATAGYDVINNGPGFTVGLTGTWNIASF